jgi:hypothetical protein
MSASTMVVSMHSLRARSSLPAVSLPQQHGVQLLDGLRAGPAHQFDRRGRVRHRLARADAPEPPPRDRVTDLSA